MEFKHCQSFVFRWNLFASLLTVFISGVTSYTQHSHACSPRQSSTESCLWFNTAISCDDTERILIRDARFGFRYTNLCEYTANSCMKSNACCSPSDGDYILEYSPEQMYDIYKECSWKQKCTKRSQAGYNGKLRSLYSVIKYECVKEKQVIHFCQESSVTGKSINIIFDGNHRHSIHNHAECTCDLVPHHNQVQYTISAPDLRLMSENGNCDSEAILSGLGNVNISCTAKFENRTSSRVMLGERQFRLGFKWRPEFVWIRAEIQGSIFSPVAQIGDLNQVTVKCYKPIQPASSTTPYSSTTKIASASTTSSDFPILAVVIPIILVISGLAVLLIFIIKCRCKNSDKMNNKEKATINNVDTIESIEKIKYENLFSPESAVRTNENYVVLEPENVYSSIRSDDIYPIQTVTGLVKSNKPYPDSKVDNGYTNLDLDSTDHETDKIEEDMNSVINDLEQVVMDEEDKHDYLVLDPHSLYQDSDTAGLSDSDSRHKSANDTYEKTLREMSD